MGDWKFRSISTNDDQYFFCYRDYHSLVGNLMAMRRDELKPLKLSKTKDKLTMAAGLGTLTKPEKPHFSMKLRMHFIFIPRKIVHHDRQTFLKIMEFHYKGVQNFRHEKAS